MTLNQAKLVVALATADGESRLAKLLGGILLYYYDTSYNSWGYFCDGQGAFVTVSQEGVASSLVHKMELVNELTELTRGVV